MILTAAQTHYILIMSANEQRWVNPPERKKHYEPQAFATHPVHLLPFVHGVHPSSPAFLIIYPFNGSTNPHIPVKTSLLLQKSIPLGQENRWAPHHGARGPL